MQKYAYKISTLPDMEFLGATFAKVAAVALLDQKSNPIVDNPAHIFGFHANPGMGKSKFIKATITALLQNIPFEYQSRLWTHAGRAQESCSESGKIVWENYISIEHNLQIRAYDTKRCNSYAFFHGYKPENIYGGLPARKMHGPDFIEHVLGTIPIRDLKTYIEIDPLPGHERQVTLYLPDDLESYEVVQTEFLPSVATLRI